MARWNFGYHPTRHQDFLAVSEGGISEHWDQTWAERRLVSSPVGPNRGGMGAGGSPMNGFL